MTLLALLTGFALGSSATLLALRAGFRRWLNSPETEKFMREQTLNSFHAGFMTAADIVTIAGQEELAGELRTIANKSNFAPANDNQ
jgi:hypothetical protein